MADGSVEQCPMTSEHDMHFGRCYCIGDDPEPTEEGGEHD